MAWRYINKHNNLFGLLGNKEGDNYIVNKDCLEILEVVLLNLLNEDRFLRTYRRMIGFGEHIRKDLLPLLVHAKNNTSANVSTKIINTTIKILQNLTIPVECLLSLEQESRTESGRQIIYELNCLLLTSKEIFTDSKNTKAVVDFLKSIIEVDTALDGEQFDYIENCFQLLRNILHIPEAPPSNVMQNQIIWNLFTQSIDKSMIHIMSYPEKMHCSVTMVQLIALMYQDQSVSNLQKLLSFWFEASLSESSEDNESNTSPQNQERGESSFVLTSDPTSDSSDNGGSRMATRTKPTIYKNKSEVYRATEMTILAQNREKTVIQRDNSFESDSTAGIATHSSDSGICTKMEETQSITEITQHSSETPQVGDKTSEEIIFSDCGYVTPVENGRESNSTSSNDDETPYKKLVHHKPPQKNRVQKVVIATTVLEKKEIRRKKLVKRGKTNIIHMKGLMNYIPTDEDISEVLKEFTVDFLLKGYGRLVQNLYSQFLTNSNLPIDISHFFWLVTYFLKFSVQLELDLELINPVLSFNIISYLVFQGVWQLEELEICRRFVDLDLQPHLRRLHLVVTSIREFLQTVETYQQNSNKCLENRSSLMKLELQICETHELKKLFLLLIREYNPDIQSKQYLRDLIVSNHAYLLLLEKNSKNNDLKLNIEDHLKEFASIEIMRQYGLLLEDFNENGKFVNNCIFTMMHHVAGDLDNLSTLFQLNILKSLSQIWETDYELCDDWCDLIEYVIQSFINYSKNNRHSSPTVKDHSTSTSVINYGTPDVASEVSMEIEWTPDENEHINMINNETSQNMHDKICNAIKNYDKSNTNTNQNEIKKILEKNEMESIIIFEDLVKKTINIQLPLFDEKNSTNDDIRVLRDHLTQDKKSNLILWLQDALLEACLAKLIVENAKLNDCNRNLIQPITYYYTLIDLPIPLVTWTNSQYYIIKHNIFALLLSKLEFMLPGDIGKNFVRIPNNWSANYLFTVAQQLGPIDTNKFKSDLNCIFKTENFTMKLETGKSDNDGNNNFAVITTNQGVSINSYTPLPTSMDWYPTTTTI